MQRETVNLKKLVSSLFLTSTILTSAVFSTGVFGEETPTKPAVSEINTVVATESTAGESQKASAEMSKAEKERAIAQMGKNQGNVWVWSEENVVPGQQRGPNGGPGQLNGGAVVLGGRPSYDPPADWYYLGYKRDGMTDEEAKALFDTQRGKFMDRMDPWGVVVEMQDNKATNAWYDVRNMQAFVLREGATTWENIMNDPAAIDWVDYFEGNMYGWVEPATRETLETGGTSVQMRPKQDRVAHWGSKQIMSVPKPESIRAVLISVEARISEKSDPEAKLGIQVGADWKFSDESPAEKPLWYPGAGLSGIQRLSGKWERYYFVSLQGIQDAMPERSIPTEQFFDTVVPLADMPAVAVDTTKPAVEKPKEDTPKAEKPKTDTAKKEDKTEVKGDTDSKVKELPKTGGANMFGFVGWLLLGLGAVLVLTGKRHIK